MVVPVSKQDENNRRQAILARICAHITRRIARHRSPLKDRMGFPLFVFCALAMTACWCGAMPAANGTNLSMVI